MDKCTTFDPKHGREKLKAALLWQDRLEGSSWQGCSFASQCMCTWEGGQRPQQPRPPSLHPMTTITVPIRQLFRIHKQAGLLI